MRHFFIRTNQGWLQDFATGYTDKLSYAGVFTTEQTKLFENVEGVKFYPISNMLETLSLEKTILEHQLKRVNFVMATGISEKVDRERGASGGER